MDLPSLPLTITISIMIISWRSIIRFVGHLAYVPWCQAAENLATSLSDNYFFSSHMFLFFIAIILTTNKLGQVLETSICLEY